MTLALVAAASIAAALLLLRGHALRRWAAWQAGAWLLFGALAAVARPLAVRVDAYLATVAFAVLTLAMLFAFVAFARAEDVRWSANRAALVALLVYALAIPAMLRYPIDGDEPFYLLITESLVKDHDVDLANQYRDLRHSATGRTDLVPQIGDPVGPRGERYSRLEPFLPILMIPGYAAAGLPGALATIAILAALLARSTVRLFEDEGISDATTRMLFPLVAFGPPIVFYAARIWPEVPGALCLVEAVRGLRQRRARRWTAALLGLVLLKLRFGLIAVVLLARASVSLRVRMTKRRLAAAALIVAVPLLIAFAISGSVLSVHRAWELLPGQPLAYVLGLFGLALDGAAGIAFQAPLYLFALIALARWRSMPAGFRLGMSSSLLYVFFLVPRAEWHGGWSPPLRYVAVFFPLLALGVAALWERIAAGPRLVAATATIALVIHGFAFPYRLFHIADGQSPLGEALSTLWRSDFSRLIPSYIRPNLAALVAGGLLVLLLAAFRDGRTFTLPAAALLAAALFAIGLRPGDRVELEDAHVVHEGGELYPREYQGQRFLFTGGWIVRAGDALSFLARGGRSALRYQSAGGATIQLDHRAYVLPPSGAGYATAAVEIARDGRVELRCLAGAANLDRMDHE